MSSPTVDIVAVSVFSVVFIVSLKQITLTLYVTQQQEEDFV